MKSSSAASLLTLRIGCALLSGCGQEKEVNERSFFVAYLQSYERYENKLIAIYTTSEFKLDKGFYEINYLGKEQATIYLNSEQGNAFQIKNNQSVNISIVLVSASNSLASQSVAIEIEKIKE